MLNGKEWLVQTAGGAAQEIVKDNAETQAWRADIAGAERFVKFYPSALYESRAVAEIAISGANLHSAIIPLLETISCADGTLLFYPWKNGETLSGKEARQRFRALPEFDKIAVLQTVFAALAAVTDVGWTLVDVYEGNLMYDYAARTIYLFDFDLSVRGDGFTLTMERNYGSSHLMAPEEFQRGAWIDARSNVFNLARIAQTTLREPTPLLAAVLTCATATEPESRYSTVRAFADAFSQSSQVYRT